MQEDIRQAVTHVLFLVTSTGAVPVRPVDRHSLLSPAPRPAATLCGQREGETTFPSNHRCRWSARSEERSHALLDPGETQVRWFFVSYDTFYSSSVCRSSFDPCISTYTEDMSALSTFFAPVTLPPAGRGWTWWEKCTTVLQSSPAVLWRTVTTLWPEAIPSTTASPGSVWSAGSSPSKHWYWFRFNPALLSLNSRFDHILLLPQGFCVPE